MMDKSMLAVMVLLFAAVLPSCHCYCKSLGWNPSFNAPPLVEQLTLTSVRVSWAGKLEQAECADNIIVKHYKGINSNDYHLSEPLPTEVTSYVVLDLTPNLEYTYQVIAREEKGLWGVDYNRGEKITLTTSIQNRDQGREVHVEDPVRESRSDFNGNVTMQEYDPVYDVSQRPKQLVAGIHIELSHSKYDGEGDDEEESDDEEEDEEVGVEEFEESGGDTKKYDMMEQMTRKLERPKLLRPMSVA